MDLKNTLKRIIFTIVFVVSSPLMFLAVFTLPFVSFICLMIWIIRGDKEDTLIDTITYPIEFIVELPYKITNL